MVNAGGGFNSHGSGGSGDLDVETVMAGQRRETGGWAGSIVFVVSGGSVNIPSLDEGIASIL